MSTFSKYFAFKDEHLEKARFEYNKNLEPNSSQEDGTFNPAKDHKLLSCPLLLRPLQKDWNKAGLDKTIGSLDTFRTKQEWWSFITQASTELTQDPGVSDDSSGDSSDDGLNNIKGIIEFYNTEAGEDSDGEDSGAVNNLEQEMTKMLKYEADLEANSKYLKPIACVLGGLFSVSESTLGYFGLSGQGVSMGLVAGISACTLILNSMLMYHAVIDIYNNFFAKRLAYVEDGEGKLTLSKDPVRGYEIDSSTNKIKAIGWGKGVLIIAAALSTAIIFAALVLTAIKKVFSFLPGKGSLIAAIIGATINGTLLALIYATGGLKVLLNLDVSFTCEKIKKWWIEFKKDLDLIGVVNKLFLTALVGLCTFFYYTIFATAMVSVAALIDVAANDPIFQTVKGILFGFFAIFSVGLNKETFVNSFYKVNPFKKKVDDEGEPVPAALVRSTAVKISLMLAPVALFIASAAGLFALSLPVVGIAFGGAVVLACLVAGIYNKTSAKAAPAEAGEKEEEEEEEEEEAAGAGAGAATNKALQTTLLAALREQNPPGTQQLGLAEIFPQRPGQPLITDPPIKNEEDPNPTTYALALAKVEENKDLTTQQSAIPG